MKKYLFSVIAILLFVSTTGIQARNFDYRLKAGFNIGGTSPMPLPREIRKIKSYTPTMAFALGGDVLYHINDKWGLQGSLKFETKGMTTKANVKGYNITLDVSNGNETGEMKGYFTGDVKTKVRNEYFTLPIVGVYKFSPQSKWQLNAGVFFSVLIESEFSGYAYNGYLRNNTPTGDRIDIIEVNDGTYDFSGDIRKFNWGGQIGASWKAYRQFSLYGDLTMAANSIFKKDFESISFDMYNVYFNVGFSYTF